MNATIQAKTTSPKHHQFYIEGYAEISEKEFNGMTRAYSLTKVVEPGSGMKSVRMMAGFDLAFLLETNDGRFFIQS